MMLRAIASAAIPPESDSILAPAQARRDLIPLAGAPLPVPAAPDLEPTQPEPSRPARAFDPRAASPREMAKRSLDLYAEGLLEWEDQAALAFQSELHPDYNRTVGALLQTRAAPDEPRDFVAEWERRLVFELRYNPENDQSVARTRRILRALRRAAGEADDVSV
ncbi:MAG: hypothetical protein FJ311_03135 [Rhodospirillales bacterium]|nr:hypothetical protein [Rhodospirillales bacterium]